MCICVSFQPLTSSNTFYLKAGNVNSGSFDPIRQVCSAANAAGAWVHVDGAFGLWAEGSPRLAHLTDGLELAQVRLSLFLSFLLAVCVCVCMCVCVCVYVCVCVFARLICCLFLACDTIVV